MRISPTKALETKSLLLKRQSYGYDMKWVFAVYRVNTMTSCINQGYTRYDQKRTVILKFHELCMLDFLIFFRCVDIYVANISHFRLSFCF